MSYHHGPNDYPPQNPGNYSSHGPPPRDRRGGGDILANVIRLVTGLIVAVFVLHMLFVVLNANQGNEFVSFIYSLAQVLVLGLGDVFTPDDAVLGVVLNYGLAALIYLVVGRLITKAIQR